MQVTLLNFLFCLFLTMNHNQSLESNSKVQVLPKWEKNEEKTYQFTNQSYELLDDDTISRNRGTYQVEMKVLDNTSNDLLLQWTYKNFVNEISEPNHSFSDLIEESFDLLDGIRFQFRISKSGEYLGLINEEEIAAFETKIFEKVKELMVSKYQMNTNSGLAFGMAKGATNPFESKDYGDFNTFFRLHGGTYDLNKEVEIPVSLGLLGKGEKMKVVLEELNQTRQEFVFRSICDFDFIGNNQQNNSLNDDFGKFSLINESKINESGWPIFSREEIITESALKTKVEIRTLELL